MKPNLRLQRKIMNVIKSTSSSGVWKFTEILASGNFTVPDNLVGNTVFVTGCGGGGSGMASARNSGNGGLATGGAGGYFVEAYPVTVEPGEVIPVTIGEGGASVVLPPSTSSTAGNPGGDTIFKTLVIKGGEGGHQSGVSGSSLICPRGGFHPGYYSIAPSPASVDLFSSSYIHGESSGVGSPGKPSYQSNGTRISAETGGAAGLFGSGTDAVTSIAANATALSALPNTGAGGGAVGIIYPTTTRDRTATSGGGGSGKLVIMYLVKE